MQVRACWGTHRKGKQKNEEKKRKSTCFAWIFFEVWVCLWQQCRSVTHVSVTFTIFLTNSLDYGRKNVYFGLCGYRLPLPILFVFQWDIKTLSLTAIYQKVQKRGWNLLPMNVEWTYYVHSKQSQAYFLNIIIYYIQHKIQFTLETSVFMTWKKKQWAWKLLQHRTTAIEP